MDWSNIRGILLLTSSILLYVVQARASEDASPTKRDLGRRNLNVLPQNEEEERRLKRCLDELAVSSSKTFSSKKSRS